MDGSDVSGRRCRRLSRPQSTPRMGQRSKGDSRGDIRVARRRCPDAAAPDCGVRRHRLRRGMGIREGQSSWVPPRATTRRTGSRYGPTLIVATDLRPWPRDGRWAVESATHRWRGCRAPRPSDLVPTATATQGESVSVDGIHLASVNGSNHGCGRDDGAELWCAAAEESGIDRSSLSTTGLSPYSPSRPGRPLSARRRRSEYSRRGR
jgi:hypothetical protein